MLSCFVMSQTSPQELRTRKTKRVCCSSTWTVAGMTFPAISTSCGSVKLSHIYLGRRTTTTRADTTLRSTGKWMRKRPTQYLEATNRIGLNLQMTKPTKVIRPTWTMDKRSRMKQAKTMKKNQRAEMRIRTNIPRSTRWLSDKLCKLESAPKSARCR